MTEQVEEIKSKTDIVGVIGEHVELKKAGRNYKANCPFHSEKIPSFIVSPDLQIFKCFGCGEGGDVIAFLQKYEGMEFLEALQNLAERAGVKLKRVDFGSKTEKERLYSLNRDALKFYHYVLLKHPKGKEALNYLKFKRGLVDETINSFLLGFSPDEFFAARGYLVDKKGYKDFELEKAGIIYKTQRGFVDRFRGRIVFPLFDHRGNVCGFAGRIMPRGRNKNLAKYINSPETPVYHKSNLLYGLNITRSVIKKRNTAVVVEGELDLISSWQAGIKNIVALKGTAFTKEQARLISRFSQRAVLAFDSDVAGDESARRGIEVAESEGLEVKITQIKGYKDPDEMARKAPEKLKNLIANAVGVWDFIIDSVFAKHDARTGEGKAKISREIIPVLSLIQDEIVKAHYAGVLAQRLRVPEEAVLDQIIKIKVFEKASKPELVKLGEGEGKSRSEILEERLLALAFQNEPEYLLKREVRDLLTSLWAIRIVDGYLAFSKKHKKFDMAEFSGKLPKELFEGFAEVVLKETGIGPDEVTYKRELELVFKELKIAQIKKKLKESGNKIREFENLKKSDKLEKEKAIFGRLSRQLSGFEI